MKLLKASVTLFVLLALLACSAGCTSPAASPAPGTPAPVPPVSQAPAKTLSTLNTSQMLLNVSDYPGTVTLVGEGERNESTVRDWMYDAGWNAGYARIVQKNESGSHSMIWQNIAKFPPGNASQIVDWQVDGLVIYDARDPENANKTYTELPVPRIGDKSRAVSIVEENDPEPMYMIAFSRYDVYEEFWTYGTATDYETLKQAAVLAAEKIQ
ncbi:MAG: hypothetical protein GX651_01315 [Methanomicrobiales archaeon]|nr:hypothetical protein [Methanomicrobiales archaeon]